MRKKTAPRSSPAKESVFLLGRFVTLAVAFPGSVKKITPVCPSTKEEEE